MNRGTLFVVATPVGNLGDMTFRGVETLRSCDLIAAEDTRVTMKLLNHFEIKKPIISYYEHNKTFRGPYLTGRILKGENVALVCDAGTPGISDPGEDIIKMALENNIKVTIIPGPCAAIAGLVVSGLATDRFVFDGFLPARKRERLKRIEEIKGQRRTVILYESPHRLGKTLVELFDILGDRNISICRELTKKFEEIIRTTLKEASEKYMEEKARGEFVIVIEGARETEGPEDFNKIQIEDHVKIYTDLGYDQREALKLVAKDRGLPKSEVYRMLVKKKGSF